jgi:peptidoglycan/xylan/chitin deacetylase (PgdA/CDA1 family)
MTSALKRAGVSVLTAPPIYRALRARALAGDPVTILCYHTLRPDGDRLESWLALTLSEFRAQVAFLRRHYDIVGLDEALDPGHRPSGRPRAVLTFDDGEAAMHDLLLPLVDAEDLPVTVYVATGQIESGRPFWFDRVMNALQGDDPLRIDMRDNGLGAWDMEPDRGTQRWETIGAILEALKTVPEEDRDALADLVVAQGGLPPADVTPFHPMTARSLQTLAAHPHVTIGAHSHGHELLDRLPVEAALASAVRSRDLLQDWTGQQIRHFAYPNGNRSPALMQALAEAGFASATILEDRLCAPTAAPMALPRVAIGRYDSLTRFKLRILGF